MPAPCQYEALHDWGGSCSSLTHTGTCVWTPPSCSQQITQNAFFNPRIQIPEEHLRPQDLTFSCPQASQTNR